MTNEHRPSTEFASTRRTVLQLLGASAGLSAFGVGSTGGTPSDSGVATYSLPELPYDYDALEPAIDERIMRLHHDVHHQGYVNGVNNACKKLASLRRSGTYDTIKSVKRDLSFNLSGHILHTLFWRQFTPGGTAGPSGSLQNAIVRDFGSVEQFRSEFSAAAESVEGSGWAMLVYDRLGEQLFVTQTESHNDLAVQGGTPLLVIDMWEHAYYLQYTTDRAEYVNGFWTIIDWDAVANRFRVAANGD